MLVEIRLFRVGGYAVEVGKQGHLLLRTRSAGLRLTHKVLNQAFGMNLFLNVQGRGLYGEGIVAVVLAAPDKLRIKIGIALLQTQAHGRKLLLPHDGLIFRRRNVGAAGFFVGDGLNGLERRRFAGHA